VEAIRKVGKDVSAGEYWRERSSAYTGGIEGPYHRHRLAMVEALVRDCDVKGSLCVDVGCGDGVFSEYLAGLGARAIIAFDPDEEMVKSTSVRLTGLDLHARVFKAGIEGLQEVDTGSADFLFVLNVIAYLTDEEERLFYSEAARAIKRGGRSSLPIPMSCSTCTP
jgi:2-polyprenyl-3-methyl-5-hydroxy-6-metoxy-1,4-benzoquinol methylase